MVTKCKKYPIGVNLTSQDVIYATARVVARLTARVGYDYER